MPGSFVVVMLREVSKSMQSVHGVFGMSRVFELLNDSKKLSPGLVVEFRLCSCHAVLASNHAIGLGLVEKVCCSWVGAPETVQCAGCGLDATVTISFIKPIPPAVHGPGLFALPAELSFECFEQVKTDYALLCAQNDRSRSREYLGWLIRQQKLGHIKVLPQSIGDFE